jgi:hypothetical protein
MMTTAALATTKLKTQSAKPAKTLKATSISSNPPRV